MHAYPAYRAEHIDRLPLRSFIVYQAQAQRLRARDVADMIRGAGGGQTEKPFEMAEKWEHPNVR